MIIESVLALTALPVGYRLLFGSCQKEREEKEMFGLLGGGKKEPEANMVPTESFSMDSCFSMFGQNSPRLKAEEISKIQGIDPKKGVYQEFRYRREY